MSRSPEATGVCVVRLTRESAGVVVHLTSRLDVSDASSEVRMTASDIEQGLALVRRFMEEYGRATSDPAPVRPVPRPGPRRR